MAMDDDDGLMLVNFSTSVDNNASSSKQIKVTGGKWKDRRKLKLKLEGRERRNKRPLDVKEDQIEVSGGFATKKPHLEDTLAKEKSVKSQPIQINSQIVSSLFTSNRQINTSVNSNERDGSAEVNPSNAPMMRDSFEALGISLPLVSHLKNVLKVEKPMKIQMLAIPELLKANNDLFIHAQTGSGKTLAFMLPILQTILSMEERIDRKSGCFAMIIAPTRELAQQMFAVASPLMQFCHYLVPCLLIGGERKKSEKARLRKGCNFIIGTPGRILDHLQNTKSIRRDLALSLRYLVLDEGDKLMELGFEKTINEILDIIHDVPCDNSRFAKLPTRITHVLCSATRKGHVNKLGNIVLKDHKVISSGQLLEEMSTAPDQLLQHITVVPPKLRLVTLAGLLNNLTVKYQRKTCRTIIFLSCSDSVDFHYEAFSASGRFASLAGDTVRKLTRGNDLFPSFADDADPNVIMYKLHGSLSQQTRTATLKHFSTDNDTTNGNHLILFCTDVASRGLDLPSLSTVIELDPPFAVEDHLHRVGRTARAGVSGQAFLFLLPGEEEGYMDYIKPLHPRGWKLLHYDTDILHPAFQGTRVQRTDRRSVADPAIITNWDSNATTWHLNIERRALDDPVFKQQATKAYTSHLRAYTTHISKEKVYFNLKYLHLGHIAKSFALRERPKAMSSLQPIDQASASKLPKEDTRSKMMRIARNTVKQSSFEFNY
ncbi:HBR450Wp [Eremothecium sinecaudum]|uniref:ATP-dependent RNA helicase n=1 Tax=Eremothecium sinecaudum TaxID=45286 RepID=A0A120K1H5_9SACH|nr:HBR450Wp [Eremothecium sinecaudum]AMD19351.1 HBR450Wp [Eremothecium sinecaudum]